MSTEFNIVRTPSISYYEILHHGLVDGGVSTAISFPFLKGMDEPYRKGFFFFLESGGTLALKGSPIIRFGRLTLSSRLSKS